MTAEELLRLYANRVHMQPEDVEYILELFGKVKAAEQKRVGPVLTAVMVALEAVQTDEEVVRLGLFRGNLIPQTLRLIAEYREGT